MMMLKAVRVSAGGILLFFGLFTMSQVTDIALAADQNKETQDKKIQNKGSDNKGIGKSSEGLPCEIPPGQNVTHAEQDARLASRLVTGELIKVDRENYVVKEESGKEVRFQTTERTEVTPVNEGDRISASIDNKNHALWIRANRGTDRRTEHASADCNPN